MLDDKILQFTKELKLKGKLPQGIFVLNPYADNPKIPAITKIFYKKFYHDNENRSLILGINPGRLGAGATGIPFTDTKRLESHCKIILPDQHTHEPSSVFVYKVIDAYGGPDLFYRQFYISSICPLGFTKHERGKEINYNYYDSPILQKIVRPFAVESLKKQLEFGINRDRCFSFGKGKNFKFISDINKEFGFFKAIVPLEHPRYIMQYKLKQAEAYLQQYLEAFASVG